MKIRFTYINHSTEVKTVRIGRAYGIAFNPKTGVKHKSKWVGLAVENAVTATALSGYFAQMAQFLAKDKGTDIVGNKQ